MRAMIMAAVFGLAALGGAAAAHAASAPDPLKWRPLDPEETLYIETTKGRVVVELYPEVAPAHVARVKRLARAHFYDGLLFHRVIDKFMAQGGDPRGDGTGGSDLPDLPAEFLFRRGADMPFVEAATQGGARVGFYKALPIASQPDAMMEITRDGKAAAWGLHCPGVASMAREADNEDSANSQFFLMREVYPSLDKRYSIWGRVVYGLDVVRSLAVGEPPPAPDKMLKVEVAADVPEKDRAPIYILRTDSQDFRELIDKTRKARGADFAICDIDIPARRTDAESKEKDEPWWRRIPLIP